ncbi:hypothetical protein [Rufibacter psychrotolerans]|uniref:hypothetical protein n=1 Tax=Rufibacter psychrotolerans TaxID=2812556 RepID=UPI001967349A|nr:hypothetical protein [Rufibacter sp. SYSU D00308]
MAKTILLIEPYLTIGVDADLDTMYIDWWGDVTKQNVLDGSALMLQMLDQEKCTKVLNINTRVHSHWKATAQWAFTDGFKALDNTTCKCFAWVKPPMSTMDADYVRRLNVENVNVCIFDSILAAERWLQGNRISKRTPALAAFEYH